MTPTKAGYEEYEVRPCLGGLEWMEGSVPTPFGKIEVSVRPGSITVHSDGGHGTLVLGDRRIPIEGELRLLGVELDRSLGV